jgi:hypothetical protein
MWSALIEGAHAQFFVPSVPFFYTPVSGTSCTAGATDLSLTTGCNVSLYHGGFF